MRHRVASNHFNRNTKARKGLLVGLVRALLLNGSITTTKAKATEIARLTDRLISKAQADSVATRRQLHTFFGKRDVVNTLVDSIAPMFTDRKSGFSTTQEIGNRRGDNALLVKLSLLKTPENIGSFKAPKTEQKAKTAKTTKTAKVADTKKTASKAVTKKPATKKAVKTTKSA